MPPRPRSLISSKGPKSDATVIERTTRSCSGTPLPELDHQDAGLELPDLAVRDLSALPLDGSTRRIACVDDDGELALGNLLRELEHPRRARRSPPLDADG